MKPLLAILALCLCSCSNSPFYVSNISAGLTKDGETIGGTVGVQIVPNPSYRLPRGYGK